jgi:Protein of unknown function (DUF4199)
LSQLPPPRTPVHTDIVARYGLIIAVLTVGLHYAFFKSGIFWQPNLWDGALLLALTMLLTGLCLFFGIRQVRRRDGYITFVRIMFYAIVISTATGLAASVYDIVFYTYVEPDFNLRILTVKREALVQFSGRNQVPDDMLAEQLKQFDEQIAFARTHPQTVAELLLARLSRVLLFGGIYGAILGVILRTPHNERPEGAL